MWTWCSFTFTLTTAFHSLDHSDWHKHEFHRRPKDTEKRKLISTLFICSNGQGISTVSKIIIIIRMIDLFATEIDSIDSNPIPGFYSCRVRIRKTASFRHVEYCSLTFLIWQHFSHSIFNLLPIFNGIFTRDTTNSFACHRSQWCCAGALFIRALCSVRALKKIQD